MLGSLPQTYFSFKLDTPYIDLELAHSGFHVDNNVFVRLLLSTCPEELAQVRNLDIQEGVLFTPDVEEDLHEVLDLLRHVKTVVLVVENARNFHEEKRRDRQHGAAHFVFLDASISLILYLFRHPELDFYYSDHELL